MQGPAGASESEVSTLVGTRLRFWQPGARCLPANTGGEQGYQSLRSTNGLSAAAVQAALAVERAVTNQQRRQQETQSLCWIMVQPALWVTEWCITSTGST